MHGAEDLVVRMLFYTILELLVLGFDPGVEFADEGQEFSNDRFHGVGELAVLDPLETQRTEDVLIGRAEVVLGKRDVDAILELGTDVQKTFPVVQQLTKRPGGFVRDKALCDQAGAGELGERLRIVFIALGVDMSDCAIERGVGQDEGNLALLEIVSEPVPVSR